MKGPKSLLLLGTPLYSFVILGKVNVYRAVLFFLCIHLCSFSLSNGRFKIFTGLDSSIDQIGQETLHSYTQLIIVVAVVVVVVLVVLNVVVVVLVLPFVVVAVVVNNVVVPRRGAAKYPVHNQ